MHILKRTSKHRAYCRSEQQQQQQQRKTGQDGKKNYTLSLKITKQVFTLVIVTVEKISQIT